MLSAQAEAEASERAAHRALLFARTSVTFFLPPGNSDAPASPLLTRLGAEIGANQVGDASRLVRTVPIAVRPLPEPKRWWRLSKRGLLPPRERESFSSLSKFIFSPYQWVLEYAAGLAAGTLSGHRVPDDAMRRGTVLHDLAGALLAPEPESSLPKVDWTRIDEPGLLRWIEQAWPLLLEDKAAQYLTPGFESARNSLLHTARRSLWRLVRNLQEAGVTEVEVERYLGGVPFVGGELGGRIDLIVRSANRVAVVDLKLGGQTYRQTELAENRHLQLAVYGHLLRSSEGVDPTVAYFILAKGSLLARSGSFFPNATCVSPENPEDASDWEICWAEFEEVWRWRRAQLDRGQIEVTVTGTEADTLPPHEHWLAPEGADGYNDFDALTGWPRTA